MAERVREERGKGGTKKNTHGLEVLLDLGVQGTSLERNDLRSRIGVVGDGRAAVGAEQAPDRLSGAARALPLLDRTLDGQLVLGDDGDESCLREQYVVSTHCDITVTLRRRASLKKKTHSRL